MFTNSTKVASTLKRKLAKRFIAQIKSKPLHYDSSVASSLAKSLVRSEVNSDFYDFSNKGSSPILLTCEHASYALPEGYQWSEGDMERKLNTDHWAYDPGAAEFSLEMGLELGCPVVLGKYSRLFVDLNRPLGSPTLMRNVCDGLPVGLNEQLDEEEKLRRASQYYLPFHFELGKVALETGAKLIISVHSYTKNYEGSERKVEVGVLYSTDNLIADSLYSSLKEGDFPETRVNEPWSGKDGFMHSCDSLAYSAANVGERGSLMLEMRNDKLVNKGWRQSLIKSMVPTIMKAVN